MSVITRFAPSPTGFLHIGGARTALFNWLYAKRKGGKFLLRIEDTDRKRSTTEAVNAILNGLDWLGIEPDEAPVYQFSRRERHVEVVNELLKRGKAYRCYSTPAELTAMREKAKSEKRTPRYDGTWRDREQSTAPPGVKPVIRLRAQTSGETIIEDAVQGKVRVANSEMDDLIMLRSDGTPTYMLSVVVDDHDMGVTHAIRGDDHLTNAFRQAQIFHAMDWQPPLYAHIPLIHGPDGAKLSKRHGALGIEAYREAGYLPEAILNYLCRLGWSHGDNEFFAIDQAISWFDISDINKSASRIDFDKLTNLNAKHIESCPTSRLLDLITPGIEDNIGAPVSDLLRMRLENGLDSLRLRAKTISELVEISLFYCISRPLKYTTKARKILDIDARSRLAALLPELSAADDWTEEIIKKVIEAHADNSGQKLGSVALPLRAALTGTHNSPSIFEVAAILGKKETLGRISDAVAMP